MERVVRVPLTRGKHALIDLADAERVLRHKWYAKHSPRSQDTFYAARGESVGGRTRTIYLHRWLLGITDQREVDHENGDTLDNRRNNLRPCTKPQNAMNRGRSTTTPTEYKGITYVERSGWRAQIAHEGRKYHLGFRSTPEEAARLYDAVARYLHGAFARCNFPDETITIPLPDLSVGQPNSSGYVGVSFDKRRGKWLAYCNVDGKRINIGRYLTAQEAASAREAFLHHDL